ncbi:hypothetical protein OJAV_G00114170 [Oryzias javanicus]|uniref:C2H2-type domain-containing protein n=1 Tax=Oryzias javanicus TaxID=123683 RepID=A0A3S2UB99_ORYJA|nr:hypothetical protein OJAV_G00114170 [Oryzias javanicus]
MFDFSITGGGACVVSCREGGADVTEHARGRSSGGKRRKKKRRLGSFPRGEDMSKAEVLKAQVRQRLAAAAEEIFGLFEAVIAEYEEQTERRRSRSSAEQEARAEPKKARADVYQTVARDEGFPSEHQDNILPVEQEHLKPAYIKEEEEQILVEAGLTYPLPVLREEIDEKPHPVLPQSPTKEEANCEAAEPEQRNQIPDLSEPESEETPRGRTSTKPENPAPGRRAAKQFPCFRCGKAFGLKDQLLRHLRCHAGEKPFRDRGNTEQHTVARTGREASAARPAAEAEAAEEPQMWRPAA